jgi:hypothetical protein
MVKVGRNLFLVAHDTKSPIETRLGTISVQEDGPQYREVGILNWPAYEKPPNDVEGICTIPNRPGEYLIVESGYYPKYGYFGRVIRIRYPEGTPGHAEYVGYFRPLPAPANNDETPRPEQIEGISVVAHEGGMTVLLLALRGGKNKPDDPDDTAAAGKLIWGTLSDIDAPNPKFTRTGTAPLSYKPIADRGAADIYVVSKTANSWDLYSVATSDPGDLGPFRSAVYSAGTITIDPPCVSFAPQENQNIVHWDFEGLKVEAVAAPAELFKGKSGVSGLSIATDDEVYNGIWRPISNSTETRSPSRLLFTKYAKEGLALK